MKTTTKDCFSNGTEWMNWTARNCDRCWKSSRPKPDGDYTAYRCRINAQIDAQAVGISEISQRTYDIAHLRDCPHRQEQRPVYRRKPRSSRNEPKLF